MLQLLLPILGSIGGQIAKNLFPDPADELKREQLKSQLQTAVIEKANELERIAADVVRSEAASQHWLAANWRPITMLVFVALIVARWMGYTAPGMTEVEYVSVYELMKIGLGGYVIGRSAEKVAPMIAAAMKK